MNSGNANTNTNNMNVRGMNISMGPANGMSPYMPNVNQQQRLQPGLQPGLQKQLMNMFQQQQQQQQQQQIIQKQQQQQKQQMGYMQSQQLPPAVQQNHRLSNPNLMSQGPMSAGSPVAVNGMPPQQQQIPGAFMPLQQLQQPVYDAQRRQMVMQQQQLLQQRQLSIGLQQQMPGGNQRSPHMQEPPQHGQLQQQKQQLQGSGGRPGLQRTSSQGLGANGMPMGMQKINAFAQTNIPAPNSAPLPNTANVQSGSIPQLQVNSNSNVNPNMKMNQGPPSMMQRPVSQNQVRMGPPQLGSSATPPTTSQNMPINMPGMMQQNGVLNNMQIGTPQTIHKQMSPPTVPQQQAMNQMMKPMGQQQQPQQQIPQQQGMNQRQSPSMVRRPLLQNQQSQQGQQLQPQQQLQQGFPQLQRTGTSSSSASLNISEKEKNFMIVKRNIGNYAVLRILDLIELISNESIENLLSLMYWERVIQIYCLPVSTFKLTTAPTKYSSNQGPSMANSNGNSPISSLTNKTGSSKLYDLPASALPKFFLSCISADTVAKFNLSLPGVKYLVLHNGSIFIFSNLSMTYFYKDGSIANISGACRMLLSRHFKIEWVELHCTDYNGSMSFDAFENMPSSRSFQEAYKMLEAYKHAVNCGLSDQAMRILQIGDVMSSMSSLMGFSVLNNVSSPIKALELFMENSNNSNTANAQPNLSASSQMTKARSHNGSNINTPSMGHGTANGKMPSKLLGEDSMLDSMGISPKTVASEDPTKKRRMSSSLNSGIYGGDKSDKKRKP